MITRITDLLPEDFDEQSRVWVYQSNRTFTLNDAFQVEDMLKTFVSNWNSHGQPVKGYANLFFGQFVVLIADETAHGVSGCSTDSSVRVVKDIENMFHVNLFDRLLLAFLIKERVQIVPMAQLPYALENGFIDSSSLYFNNTVQTLQQLRENWLIPLKASWLARDKRFNEKLGQSSIAG